MIKKIMQGVSEFTRTTIVVACVLCLVIAVPSNVFAARLIQQVLLDGAANVSVFPATSMTATVNVTTSGNGARSQWRSTAWRIPAGFETCIEHSDYDAPGDYTENFEIIAPASAGTYDLEFIAYAEDSCSGTASNTYTMTAAVTVVKSPEVNYRFDEEEWTGVVDEVKDSSGNDYHATAVNGPTTDLSSPAIPGSPGTCSYGVFDGVDDYVALPTGYPNITGDYTITAWIRTTNNTRSGQRILIDDPNNTQGFGFSLGDGGTGRVRFFSRSTNPIILDTPNVVANNLWYYVAAVADISNNTKRIYVYDQAGNQLAAVSDTYSGSWGYDVGDASMGGENDASNEPGSNFHFEGNVDEVRVHEGALTETQISMLQNTVRICARPVAEYRFDLCSETDAVFDDSGNGFDGNVINGPLAIDRGKICNGAYFDGVDDYVEVDDSDLFDNTSELTIAGWINPENINAPPPGTNARGIISKRNNASSNVSYGIFFYSERADGKLYVDIDTTNNRFASNSVIPEGEWTHFAVVFDGNLPANERVKLYLNGVLDKTATESSTTIPDYNSDLYIGNLYYGLSELKVYQGMLDELRVIPEVLSSGDIQALFTATRSGCQSCSLEIDHYRFSHDDSALTCSPENIQIKACLDENCIDEFSEDIDAILSPSGWVGGDTRIFSSGDTLQLWHTTAETALLNIFGNGSEYVAVNPPRCFIGATEQPDCGLRFHDSGFVLDVPDHVADVTQNATIAAVRKDQVTEQCVPGFQNVVRDVDFWSSYLDPLSGSLPVRVNGVPINGTTPGSSVSLLFDAAGEAALTVAYADVGQMALNAGYVGSGDDSGLVMTGTDSFITRPDHFELNIPGNPAAVSAADGVFKKAGDSFPVEVSARNASGNVTPNYGREAVPETVQLGHSLVAPSGQHDPLLTGTFELFGNDCDGNVAAGYACGQFSWDEVGIIDLLPAVGDGNYLGTGNVTGSASGNVGRFIPDRFAFSANTPAFGHGCAAGTFSYLGQQFGYLIDPKLTLEAWGTSGSLLLNYGDVFWKYSGALSGRSYSNSAAALATVSLTTSGTTTLSGDDDYDGTGEVSIAGDQLTYTKPVTPLMPFSTSVDLNFSIADLTDDDGVCYDPDNDGTCDPFSLVGIGDTEQRFGRLQLQNAYGSELLPLNVPLQTEYYSTGGFYAINTDDGCTALTTTDHLQLSTDGGTTWSSGDTAMSLGAGSTSAALANSPLNNGEAGLSFSAPGAGNAGDVHIRTSIGAAYPWLLHDWNADGSEDEASARATFGIFNGNQRLIYMRESIW